VTGGVLGQSRARTGTRAGHRLTAVEAAWLAVAPAAAVGVAAIALLGPALGRSLLVPAHVHFWPYFASLVHPEPVEQGRYAIAVLVPLLLAGFTVAGVGMRPRWSAATVDALVVAVKVACAAFVLICVLAQKQAFGRLYPRAASIPTIDYFKTATLLAAAAGTIGLAVVARLPRARQWLVERTRDTGRRRLVAGVVAGGAIVVWLLHAVYTERTIGSAHPAVAFHIQFPLDETFAVLDGRSPLVNFAAQYGSLWPYAFAGGMSLLGETVGVWVVLALCATGVGMAAIFAVLRRAARSSIGGLLLFLPVLSASFFRIRGGLANRYTFGDYFGTFPMRYAGPSLLAWLVARHLDGSSPRRPWLLFLAGGLVVLNNVDTGLAALAATAAALIWGGGSLGAKRAASIVRELTVGVAAALALVCALTLARAGALPHLDLLVSYSRLFALNGFAMQRMPLLGLHLVLYLTFVAALGVATGRALRDERGLLTGMLAWSGAFGLGAGAYYAGRSTPDDLIALFLPWSFALSLLMIPAAQALAAGSWRRPPAVAISCAFAFLVLACSLAQTPTPWEQLRRLGRSGSPVLAQPARQRFIARHTRRGEPAALLVPLGHQVAARLGVVDVVPYSSILSMPTDEQLEKTLLELRAAGGGKLFLAPTFATYAVPPIREVDLAQGMELALRTAGYALAARDDRAETELWVAPGSR
jgi:hypothetical protein